MNRIFFFIIVCFGIGLFSCKKESISTSANSFIQTNVDSIKFDTVFTSSGNVTKQFKIINNNDQKIVLSNVQLMGGNSSAFRINLNGMQGNQFSDFAIAANDSAYVFVTVFVNPNLSTSPFVLQDSIKINWNGNTKFVQLEAYGQNAIYLNHHHISSNTTWTNALPIVIKDSLFVDENVQLNISSGTKIYSHSGSPIIVNGTLKTNGTAANPVEFLGDRLDDPYKYFPGSWYGIIFSASSKDNQLIHAQIKNAISGIVVVGAANQPKLVLQQCIIDNASNFGLLAINSSVNANNSLITNSGNTVSLQGGGNYNFENCTIAAYGTRYILHAKPAVYISNGYFDDATQFDNNITANFKNSIIYGLGMQNEFSVQKIGNSSVDITLDHSIYKAETNPAYTVFNQCISNVDPKFDSIDQVRNIFDFRTSKHLDAPGINQGSATSLLFDLLDLPRTVDATDIGCYEKQ